MQMKSVIKIIFKYIKNNILYPSKENKISKRNINTHKQTIKTDYKHKENVKLSQEWINNL